jgi:hypothetical protein
VKEPRIRLKRTPKPSTSFRLSILARRELEELVRRYGISRTSMVEIAIDRMYHEEVARQGEEPS